MNDMSFEQIKAITEKYGPVLDQLDRLLEGQQRPATYCIPDYYNQISEMKAAVATIKVIPGPCFNRTVEPIFNSFIHFKFW